MEAGRQNPEIVTLTLPFEERFILVARILVGGLAARLDLPYEHVDDLQLAAEAVLAEPRCSTGDEVTIELAVADRESAMSIGPLDLQALESTLHDERTEGIGLGTLLRAVVDDIDIDDRDGSPWLRLRKRVPARPRS